MPFPSRLDPVGFLARHRDGGDVQVVLREASPADGRGWEQSWKPRFQACVDEELRAVGGWPITDYFTRSLSDPSTQCLVIARAEQMEALIALRIAAGESRLGRGASMLYVDYLLSGPDNLRPPVGRLELKALGPVLIAGAALLSDRLGFEGRLGLHSKPASETFYRRQGFTEVGPERTDDGVWVYFELSPEGATKLLRGGA